MLPALLRGEAVGQPVPVAPGLRPAVTRLPPLAVGGRSDAAALMRAARYGDQWLSMWRSPATITRRAARLAELAAACGRPAPAVTLLIGIPVVPEVDSRPGRVRASLAPSRT